MARDDETPGDHCGVRELDDFEVIAERQRIMAALTAHTDRYRALNREISTRETLAWMLAR